MGGDSDFVDKVVGVEDLNLSSRVVSRIGQESVFTVTGESTETEWIQRCFSDYVNHFHVSDVVDMKTLFQTHNQSLSIQLHSKDRT